MQQQTHKDIIVQAHIHNAVVDIYNISTPYNAYCIAIRIYIAVLWIARIARIARIESAVNTTRVVFKALSDGQIDDYLLRDQPYDCAGSFKSECLGISLCAAIYSDDPSSLVGLPLITTGELLAKIGYNSN